jgi:uncharacterized membrane protein
MAFCAQCGTQVDASFCPSCGAAQSSVPAMPTQIQFKAAPLEENIVCALCYLLWPLTGALFLVLEPYNKPPAVRFHALQSAISFAFFFAGGLALSVLAYTPIVGILFTLVAIFYLPAWCLLILYLLVSTYTKKKVVLPVIGAIAEKQV